MDAHWVKSNCGDKREKDVGTVSFSVSSVLTLVHALNNETVIVQSMVVPKAITTDCHCMDDTQ